MERTTLSFTVENIVTITIMVVLVFVGFSTIARLAHKGMNNG